jgi:hypothetical protein
MVDKINFMAVYGAKTTFETKVSVAVCASFHSHIMESNMDSHKAEGGRHQFVAAWKAYLLANQAQGRRRSPSRFRCIFLAAGGRGQ